MRARVASIMSYPPCARWPGDSANALRRIRAGTISSEQSSSEQSSSERGMNEQANAGPGGDLCIRTLAMPADTNANGDIFGGWLLSQMDVAAACLRQRSQSRAR